MRPRRHRAREKVGSLVRVCAAPRTHTRRRRSRRSVFLTFAFAVLALSHWRHNLSHCHGMEGVVGCQTPFGLLDQKEDALWPDTEVCR
jgi:hypothetical protein